MNRRRTSWRWLSGRLKILAAVLVALIVVLTACGDEEDLSPTPSQGGSNNVSSQGAKQWTSPPAMQLEAGKDYQATVRTSKGDIVIDLLESEAPITVNNFVFLANEGYYDGVSFHRIMKGFMVQTGDPTGTGAGSPGYRFQDEPITRDYKPGTVAMANAGPNTNGSQFFIVHGDMTGKLQKNYTIFGQVVSGMDVLDAIANVPVTTDRFGEASSPTETVTITSVDIQ